MLFAFLFSQMAFAKDKKNDLLGKKNISTSTIDKKKSKKADKSNIILAVAGGYFTPLGTVLDQVNGSYTIKMFVSIDKINHTHFGFAFDTGFALLPDKVYDGNLLYYHILPKLTVTFSPWNILDLQIKAGVGLTVFYTKLTSQGVSVTTTGLAPTLTAGFVVMKRFLDTYVVGIEANVYYYAQRESQGGFSSYFFVGYNF